MRASAIHRIDIKELRLARRLSLRTVAAEMGIPFTTLARVEQKGSRPFLQTAQRIAAYYDLPVEAIWSVDDGKDAA